MSKALLAQAPWAGLPESCSKISLLRLASALIHSYTSSPPSCKGAPSEALISQTASRYTNSLSILSLSAGLEFDKS